MDKCKFSLDKLHLLCNEHPTSVIRDEYIILEYPTSNRTNLWITTEFDEMFYKDI